MHFYIHIYTYIYVVHTHNTVGYRTLHQRRIVPTMCVGINPQLTGAFLTPTKYLFHLSVTTLKDPEVREPLGEPVWR